MYQPQPQQWGGQPGQPPYMQMPPVPKQPSIITDPKALVDKLPLTALIVFCGFAAAALFDLISYVIPGYGVARSIIGAIGSICYYCAFGVLGFALLMALKYFFDLKKAEAEAAAAPAEDK